MLGSAPKDVHVQVVLAGMYQVVHDEASQQARWTWQPWLCPPLFVFSTKARVLPEGLERVLPLKLRDQKSLGDFCKGSALTHCTMTHDMASSNVSAVGVLTKHIEESGPACDGFLMHAERCLTHCIHIAKIRLPVFVGECVYVVLVVSDVGEQPSSPQPHQGHAEER